MKLHVYIGILFVLLSSNVVAAEPGEPDLCHAAVLLELANR